MNNSTVKIKVKQRLNKLASNDYDNIHDWQIVEAFNKAAMMWCRRTLQGTNMSKTGDEATKHRITDLQVLLTPFKLSLIKHDVYAESQNYPEDFFEWKRLSAFGVSDCCQEKHPLKIYLAEESNVDMLLADPNKKPSFIWSETFCTVAGNKIKIFNGGEFDIDDATLTYYKLPRKIEMLGTSNPYTSEVSTVEVESEFKDDIVEILIDETVKILSGDTENINTNQLADNNVESNN